MPKSKTSLNQLIHEIRRVSESREVLTDKKIDAIYKTLHQDLNAFLADTYIKYADRDGRMYISYLDEQRKRAWFMSEIAKKVDKMSTPLKKEIMALVDKTYTECYKGMIEALRTVTTKKEFENIAKDLNVPPEVLKQAVNNNISKLTLPRVLEKNRAEITYQIQQELNIGLINGDRYETMAKRISERLNISKGKAMNITRTETHRNIESGLMDSAELFSSKLDGSDLIYAVTWRTMKDNRVRPLQRRKTAKGWKTTRSTNGANHIQMEGVTVKVGELFNLGEGIKTKAPSQSGYAKHDCNCRCFLEYNLLTVEEFANVTDQTPEQVRKKYGMLPKTKTDSTVKEKDLTNKGKSDIISLPKSLEHFDDYQKKWVETELSGVPAKTKEALEKNIKTVIDNNAYAMRVNSKDLQSIIDNGFLNQLETKTSGGTLSSDRRKTASYRLFGNDALKMDAHDFEKYGYLGSYDFAVDSATSDAWQYGKTIVHFSKEKLKDRVTYTMDDSLGNALYGRVVGGKIGDECSISGIAKYDIGYATDTFKYASRDDLFNPDKLAQDMGARYWELQYHGELSINDVESICFTGTDRPTTAIIRQFRRLGIKMYRLKKGGVISEL